MILKPLLWIIALLFASIVARVIRGRDDGSFCYLLFNSINFVLVIMIIYWVFGLCAGVWHWAVPIMVS